jgi:hypothetical protein
MALEDGLLRWLEANNEAGAAGEGVCDDSGGTGSAVSDGDCWRTRAACVRTLAGTIV